MFVLYYLIIYMLIKNSLYLFIITIDSIQICWNRVSLTLKRLSSPKKTQDRNSNFFLNMLEHRSFKSFSKHYLRRNWKLYCETKTPIWCSRIDATLSFYCNDLLFIFIKLRNFVIAISKTITIEHVYYTYIIIYLLGYTYCCKISNFPNAEF